MRVVIRAFNKDGYHKDILIASERQVHQHDRRVVQPKDSTLSGLIGFGGRIEPSEFPEMTHFEIVFVEGR